MDRKVTASAIPRVRKEVERYAGSENTVTKLSRVKPGLTREVKGSTYQNAVTRSKKSETI
jgi:hypothetical protein